MSKFIVAILGGAFDPITVGHIQLAQYVLNSTFLFNEVWLMPCWKHLYDKKMVDAKHRLEMCKIAAQDDVRIYVSDYEIRNKLSGKTFELVSKLCEDPALEDYTFSMIIGMDNAMSFDKWFNHEKLKEMIGFIVVPRKGYTLGRKHRGLWFMEYPHVYLGHVDSPIDEVSSTAVRDGLASGSDISHMLSPDVLSYIESNGLYR